MISDATQARQLFLATGVCNDAVTPPPIMRSWQRCAVAQLDPEEPGRSASPPTPSPLGTHQSGLITLVRPYMEDLYQFVEGSGFAVLLADAALTLIELIGDAEIVKEIAQLGLGCGSSWGEDCVGAMAMNLALHEALPCQTRGAEHYCSRYHRFACSAAPLFEVGGQAIGVLGVLGYNDAAHAHTLGMVIAAAHAIHMQLRNNLLLAETNDHLAELSAAIESMSEGLIFLDSHGRLSKMNSRAGHLLSLSPRSAPGRPLEELIEIPAALRPALDRRRELNDQEVVFVGRKGSIAVLCSVRPVWDRTRRYLGSLITLRPQETVHRLVQRVVGAEAHFTFADIVGDSPSMQAAIRYARVAANSHTPILIQGELGVGKEMFAHAIHDGGGRADGPLIALNCPAVPRALLIDELFGFEGGQHDQRSGGRPGKLQFAQGGSLLLQEVGELPIDVQTGLLRAIDTAHLVRTGGQRVVPLDVRIIATTTYDLRPAVAAGRFRADLYHRLGVLTIEIPPLRERGDDVLMLINEQVTTLSLRMGKQVLLAPDALAALLCHSWPGNVRELETTIEQLLHGTEKSILTLSDLPPAVVNAASVANSATSLLYDQHALVEREVILRAGQAAAGHLGRAAERLGVSRATLWRKMKLYGLTKEQFWQPILSD